MFDWLRARLDRLANRTQDNRALSLVANWLANVLWLIDTKFMSLAQEAYGKNAIVYACLRLLSQSVPEAPLKAYVIDGEEERTEIDRNHPLRKLIERPNELMTEYEFWELTTLHMGIIGRSAWFKERDRKGEITALWPLRPDRVGPIYATAENEERVLVGYSYQTPGEGSFTPIPRRDILAFNFPDPSGETGGIVEGLGPVQVLSREISADNEATGFVGALLANYAAPTVALKVKAAVRDETEAALVKARFRHEFSGARRGTPAVIDADTDIQMLGFNLRQLEFPDVRANAEARVAAVFGVPAILVGLKVGIESSIRATIAEQRRYFTETTLRNYWRRYQDQFQHDIAEEFGENIIVEFDTSNIQALAMRRQEQIQPVMEAFKLGAVTRNEYRIAMGIDAVENGDVFLIPGNVLEIPAEEQAEVVAARAWSRLVEPKALSEPTEYDDDG